jgi:tRNA1Val (adenine37-N6)-methyltransferase
MSNTFFRFKHFTIHQDKCAMKVCTDACLFAAWLTNKMQIPNPKFQKVLDIGTGTGLLALMYAQKNPFAFIDAVEIDKAAALQAKENFRASPWKERLHIYNTSIQQFSNSKIPQFRQSTSQPINQSTRYDLIISNPPFFENHLKSNDAIRNLALHSEELSLEELLNAIDINLKDDGNFAVLLPYHRTKQFIDSALGNSFHPAEKILIKQTQTHNYFRSILLFTREEVSTKQSETIIQNEDGKYTNEFVKFLRDYYLYL